MDFFGIPPIQPLLFYGGKISGYVLIGFYLKKLLNMPSFSIWWKDISFWLLIGGILIILTSLKFLGNSLSFGLPREQTKLKTSGLYRFSRNPIYLGLYLILFASALSLHLWWAWVIAIFNIIIYHRIILAEELFLAEKFGEAYHNYCKSVRRYL
ncbi:methyltransferase family protein [Persicobacter diffluens]|uniref:Isoprenylcysteine carboxylmethyltransferase family protein n=1 Tax=Persicobacter diffluens TaxID=981 RepID=A0AAN4VZ51_9BACT|nr:hypothetical protein PEDI_15770 [Persicobacter diffluens]